MSHPRFAAESIGERDSVPAQRLSGVTGDQSYLESLLGGDRPTEMGQVHGPAEPDDAGQALRAPRAGEDSNRHFRHPERRQLGRHAKVTPERELQSCPDAGAVDRRDDGLLQGLGQLGRPRPKERRA
ncbi:MAG: hypothetical protein AVDCRST_MAG34-2293 [uncultured Nocardioidaceae bacterium]|uniref:Uncharacterized protein n=1 Tax=uncultured Nocardioidaceae bacterium TaxID=253824 RepID=A0A6J4MIR2_9ACTN|nr:MAG: hypothetical protein AVDCRST_MAG34-2293 [uncultured Nocardioidaceae bacterium]